MLFNKACPCALYIKQICQYSSIKLSLQIKSITNKPEEIGEIIQIPENSASTLSVLLHNLKHFTFN